MGHVDHGKTTLLDYIRKTNVAGREAGGITQGVAAYEIMHNGKKITFVDTPGHEAFTKMRSAGAQVADLAILVVAAEEGIKPQTKEAIRILNETKTPFVVAINKIDKKEANVEKAKNDLLSAGVLLEGYGGQISYHGVSAKTGDGVSELLDLVALTAEVQGLSYDPDAQASGFVLEAKMDRQRGLEATVIVKEGTLKSGDYLATPSAKGKIKILENFLGERTKKLEPSAPALVMGFETLPKVGETFAAGSSEKEVSHVLKEKISTHGRKAPDPEVKKGTLKLILKASDIGSLEALSFAVKNLKAEDKPVIFSESVGDVSDGDIKMAIPTEAVIIGFKIRVSQAARNLAEANGVKIITSDIVYDLLKTIEEFLKKPEGAEITGTLEVLAIFNQDKMPKQLVGGKVTTGTFRNKSPFEIERAGNAVAKGRITNLQQQKKDVNAVPEGNEAGAIVESATPIQVGDRLVIRK